MGKDDDLYDELYGDDDDEARPIPAAPPRSPRIQDPQGGPRHGGGLPRRRPPAAPNADDDSDDDFDIALNEPDVGDPDDPDDFKIVLDDTEQLYGTGHTAELHAEDASAPRPTPRTSPPWTACQAPPRRPDGPTSRRASAERHPLPKQDLSPRRRPPGRPPPPALPRDARQPRRGARGTAPPAPLPGRPSFAPPAGVPRDSAMAGGAGRPPRPRPPRRRRACPSTEARP